MNLFDFNPPRQRIQIDSAFYVLNALSIKYMALIKQKYNTFRHFRSIFSIANKNIFKPQFALCAAWLTYILLEKNNFFKSAIHFEKKFFNQKTEIYTRNINALICTVNDSQPIHNVGQAIKNDNENQDENEEDFSLLYIIISREISGYTVDRFYDLTLRQINQIQKDLQKEKNQEIEFQAKIHGAKIVKRYNNRLNSEINFSKKENDKIEKFAKQQMARMKAEAQIMEENEKNRNRTQE
jgi:hypothetical protein